MNLTSVPNPSNGLYPIMLKTHQDGSVEGALPSGRVVTWPNDYSTKPTLRHSKVRVDCSYWEAVWGDGQVAASAQA